MLIVFSSTGDLHEFAPGAWPVTFNFSVSGKPLQGAGRGLRWADAVSVLIDFSRQSMPPVH
jgi:hypothetical protein